jgi:hypothetical protein
MFFSDICGQISINTKQSENHRQTKNKQTLMTNKPFKAWSDRQQ